MNKRVFVSSTFKDLTAYRNAVRHAIRQLGAIDISMENFGARDDRPKDLCIKLIKEETDVFVGIYAHRYGFIAEGDDISILEAEYNTATTEGLERRIYLIEDSVKWPAKYKDKGKNAKKLLRLKETLERSHTCGFFTGKEQLAASVAADLGRYFIEGLQVVSIGHRGIFHKPAMNWASPVIKNPYRYKVIAFDLDGTLLRGKGFQFSWEIVWNGLKFGRGIQAGLKREYHKKAASSSNEAARILAYQEWCQKACQHFIRRKLTRKQLSDFIKPIKLTKNFKKAISNLRNEGFVLAIISGGINTLLEEKIPNFKKLFDFVFINELKFSPDGLLSEVVPTEYDFEGKEKALEYVMKTAGCTEDETVFIGDAFNDKNIMLRAGKAIAYPPKDNPVDAVCQVKIEEDNLNQILPHIFEA